MEIWGEEKFFSNFTMPNRNDMEHTDLIERNPEVMLGKPVIKGTRITVELIVRKIAGGYSIDELLKAYPHLTRQQIQAALEFAADVVANEEVITS